MPRTPNPSAADILDIYLRKTGDYLDSALEEIRLRLEENLPGVIDLKNQRKGWLSKATAIPKPKEYLIAPAELTSAHCNTILVGVSAETGALGIGGAFKNDVEVLVYSVDEPANAPTQILNHWRRAQLIRGALLPFLNSCVDADDVECWRSFVPTGFTMLPRAWAATHSGIACTFRMILPPTDE